MIERTIERHGYLSGLSARRSIASLTRAILERLLPASPSDRLLSIEERIAIAPKQTLMLVNCVGRRFLVVTAGDTIAPIIEVQPFVKDSSGCPNRVSGDRQEGRL